MAKKKGLGRGLDMLIPSSPVMHKNPGEDNIAALTKREDHEKAEDNGAVLIDINKIEPNRDQPRKQFDESAIEELADSIKRYGVIQPLLVQKKDHYYEIIAGERRWRACKKSGVKKVPVIIGEYDEDEILKIALIENLQREDLNPIEEARAYERLKKDYGLKQDEIAESVAKSRTAVTNIMRLLKLDHRVQNMLLEGLISSGHGRAILSVEDHDKQFKIATKVLEEGLSVRDVERLVRRLNKPQKEDQEKEDPQQEEMTHFFEDKMKNILGSKVTIRNKKNNKGKIEIEYYSKDELERIIELIQSIDHQ